MARDPDAKHRRLAAIVFTDIVGYSAIVNRDEAEGARALDLQRRIVRKQLSSYGGREIETAGDSFLLEFASSHAALRCVAAIQRDLRGRRSSGAGDVPVVLRASLHVGDIAHRRREVFGDAVNVAARLLPLAPEGGLALSKAVLSQLRGRLPEAPRSLGECRLKNIAEAVEVFVYEPDRLDALPLDPPSVNPDGGNRGRFDRRRLSYAVAALVAVAGMFLLLPKLLAPRNATDSPGAHQRIAVLPFASFSSGADDSMIAAGLQDSILTNLARVDDLRVISRTSVQPYQSSNTRKIREIASELEVDSIIEGSLQRNGDRIMVQVQLIDAATDHHLWAQSYERDIGDLFTVQSAIARDVAQAVKVKFGAPQVQALDTTPTRSVAAYTEYQRAIAELDRDSSRFPEAQAALERALALDPDFPLALVLEAEVQVRRFASNVDRSEAPLLAAKTALIRAAELQPDLPQLHRGWGRYYAEGRRDLESAVAEYQTALRLMPNDAETLNAIGTVYREQDRLSDALVALRRAAEMAPRSVDAQLNVISVLELMRNYPAAETALDRIAAIEPDSQLLPVYRARLALVQGDQAKAREWMTKITYAPALEQLHYYLGDLDEAIRQIKRQPEWQDNGTGAAAYPIHANLGFKLWLRGDQDASRVQMAKVVAILEPLVAIPDPAPWDQRGALALAYARLGRLAESRALIDRIQREDCCPSPTSRADILSTIAFTELALGNRPAAIAAIDRILSASSFVSAEFVAMDPGYRELHGDPAFEALLDKARAARPAATRIAARGGR